MEKGVVMEEEKNEEKLETKEENKQQAKKSGRCFRQNCYKFSK